MRDWSAAPGQPRSRPLSATLAAARAAAARAGVTRLADVTGLGGLGVPTFQAVRPLSRSLSVSQGKGLTAMAAAVSALLEAVELDLAERVAAPPEPPVPLRALSTEDVATWSSGARDRLAIRLDPARSRPWVRGVDLAAGRGAWLPWDLLSLDTTRPPSPDLLPTSVGLATGNSRSEALAGGLAEAIEHHLLARFDALSPRERRALELDLASVDDAEARKLLDGMARRGFAARVWEIGAEAGAPAFHCSLFPASGRSATLGPAGGSGCHPSRAAALIRALLEAGQSRATLVAGARDDLSANAYRDAERRQRDLVLAGLSFGPGPRRWADVADHAQGNAEDDAALLLDVVGRLTPLPVLAFDHSAPHPELHVVHIVAPGLIRLARGRLEERSDRPTPPPFLNRRARRRPVLFAGPSLPAADVLDTIELRPPALCGDLAALLDDLPPAVGLVDGCFELAPTVWHKEVLDLLAHGVPVLGAASLGAIRAAELATMGMEGVGAVFTGYASGAIRRDDAVMLDHSPAELGFRPLTLSLVDAEAALAAAPMPAVDRRLLQRIARTTCYRERTWALCLRRLAERTGRPAPVTEEALAAIPSLKRRDARALAARLLEARAPAPRHRPPITKFYRRLLATSARPAPPPDRPAPARGAQDA